MFMLVTNSHSWSFVDVIATNNWCYKVCKTKVAELVQVSPVTFTITRMNKQTKEWVNERNQQNKCKKEEKKERIIAISRNNRNYRIDGID